MVTFFPYLYSCRRSWCSNWGGINLKKSSRATLITVQWTQKRKKKKTTTTNSPSRFNAFKPPQNPRTQRHEGSERIAKEHMCARYRLLIGWQLSPLGHQNLTRLLISSNISVVAIGSNQSLRGIYITSGYGSHRLFETRSRIFLPIPQSCATLLCCRLAILESSLEWLVGNHDPQHRILHAFSFERSHC